MKFILRSLLTLAIVVNISTLSVAQKKNTNKPKSAAAKEKGTLFFERTFVDMGSIDDQEESIPVEFPFTNISKVPVKITDVKTECSCSVPEWPKDAINHNEKKSIVVRFFPKKLSNTLQKTITVYTDGHPNVYQLKFSIYVNDKFAKLEKRFPSSQGSLKFTTYDIRLKPMFTYSFDSTVVQIYNPTEKTIKITNIISKPHIEVIPDAMQIIPQGIISVKLKYHAARSKDYGNRKDDVLLLTDDVSFPEKKLLISTTINEDFANLTEKEKANPPVFSAVTPVVDLDTISANSVKTVTFKVKNTGKTPMYIRKAWGSCGCTEVKFDPSKPIKKNKEATISVTYNSTYELGTVSKKIFVITNTPQQPQHEMILKANIILRK